MRPTGGVFLIVLLRCGAEPFPDACEAVCRGLECEATRAECAQAESLFGCACDGCAACRPQGRHLLEGAANSTGCAKPCLGDAGGCDAFVPLGATCLDLESSEYLQIGALSCDCSGCLLCDETDNFAPAADACDGGGGGGAVLEISTEAELTAALAAGAPCTAVSLGGDVALGEAILFEQAVRVFGAERPVLSPVGLHRLVTVTNQSAASLTSLKLRDGFDAFAGGCVFVAGGSALTLDRVAFENCRAGHFGGGVAAWTAASLRTSQSSFVFNTAGNYGGAVYGHSRAAVVITDATTIGTSSALVGGAVAAQGGLDVSEGSRIDACFAITGGGCVVGRAAVFTLSSSVVAASHAEIGGGGLFGFTASTAVIGRSIFANCTAGVNAGGAQLFLVDAATVSDSTFWGCTAMAAAGGGIVTKSATFANVEFRRCAAPGHFGGGLAVVRGIAALADSRFVDCAAGKNGGALVPVSQGLISLARTSITACHAAGDGGALFVTAGCRVSIDTSTLADNTAGGDGGAIAVGANARVMVFGRTRVERNAAVRGGGLALLPASTVGVANAVVSQNVAVSGGGAAFVGTGADLHLGRAALLSRNIAASDGGAVEVRGKGAELYVSASCSFVQVTLDWTAAQTLDAAEAFVLLDYAAGPAGLERDALGASTRFAPENGAATRSEACLPPGRRYELWAASLEGRSWLEGSWALALPPRGSDVLSSVDARVTFVQAVNEYSVLGLCDEQAHGAKVAAFYLDDDYLDDDESYAPAAGGDAVRIVGNVAVAGDGGGVAVVDAGRAILYEALLEMNVALVGSGGAVAVGAQSTAELRGVGFDANVAGRDGGALKVGLLGVVDICNSTATANAAGGRGGFAALDRVRTASLRNVVARGNRAADRGGALALALCDQDPVVVSHSTFQNNSAERGGGALDAEASFLRIEGATLFQNNSVDAGSGGGVSVRPNGAALALAPQPEACVAVLRVVLDWRRNAERCQLIGAIEELTNNNDFLAENIEGTCDTSESGCDTFSRYAVCGGCTCKAGQPGAGESAFHVDRVADADGARTRAAPLFVGEPDAGAAKEFEYCLEAGEYEVIAYDRRGAAWFGGTLEATVWVFDGLAPFHRERAEWSPSGFKTAPVRFGVAGVSQRDLAVRFVDNTALKGGGAAVSWAVEPPAGLEAAETYSSGNAAAYGPFAATPATKLLINNTLSTVYAVPNAAVPAISAVLVDDYGQVVRADSTTAVSAEFINDARGVVQASGLVAICVRGVATFDAITITGIPGDARRLRFLAPSFALETALLTVELLPCPVGFVERLDGKAVASCIACSYIEFYSRGRCVPCPRGAACDRYEPLDASSALVGYQLFTVETLPIKRGFYRFYATSDEIYECPDASYCSAADCSCAGVGYEEAFRDASKTHSSRLCAANSEGPLCALCEEGYPRPSSLGQGGGCSKCDGDSVLPIFFASVFAALLAAVAVGAAVVVACAGVATTRHRFLQAASFAQSRWFVVAAMQVWYAVSTVSRFVAIEDVDYPWPLQTVLRYLAFFSLDLAFAIPSMQCYHKVTYFELFLSCTLFPLAFGAFLAFGVVAVAAARVRGPPWPNDVWRQLTRTVSGRATRRTAKSLFWLVLVLLHNYICSIIFTFYSCSDVFYVSDTKREQWLAYDYSVRCGSDAYRAFEGAAAALLVLYVVVVPASLALKLKLNRRAGLPDGALAFFTQHVRPAIWYYEIAALEVRLVICGALVPVTGRGLRLTILLVVVCAWTILTKGMRPYINRGHMALVNYLQIFNLSCIVLALVLYSQLLSDTAAKAFAYVVSVFAVAITVRLYSAFKSEEINEVLEAVRSRRAFDRADFLRLHVGMNVRVLNDAVFAAALAILDDEFRETPTNAALAAGAAAAPGWAYLTTHLLPLRDVWARAVPTRTLLASHTPRLLANAALLARTRARSAPAAGGLFISEKQFTKDIDSVLGPLAQELRGGVVAAMFARFAAETPRPMLDFNACFEPALRAIIDALIRDHATDEEEDLDGSFHGAVAASLRGVAVAVSAKKLLALSKKYDAEMQDDENVPEDGARGAGEERVSRMQRLRLRLTGRHATRGSPSVETPRPSQTQATPPAPGEAGRRHDAFFDLAAHAHAANFECWVDMEEAAAAILADPDWGARISALEDFSDGAVLQTPLRDPHLAAWVAGLGGDSKALREQFDEAVLPHALRSVALDAHPAFIAALQALLCEPDDDAVDDDGGGENLRASWVSKCELYKSGASTAVKSAARMSVKVDEYCCEDGPASSWPRAARITDPLRATVVCDDAEAIVRVYTALVGDASAAHTFRVTRLKNKLALCTKPFNLHVNCAFDRGAGAAPITTEIQIIPRAVNAVTGPSHKFYTLSRASHAGALVT